MKRIETILLLIIGTVWFLLYWSFQADDSFIYLRYGKNLLESGIWSYNSSDSIPEEAYTGFLWALLGIIPNLLNIDPILVLRGLNLALTFFLFIRVKDMIPPEKRILMWVIFPNVLLFIHFFSGMETFFFMGLLFLLALELKRDADSKLLPWICLALPLLRPEAALISLIILSYSGTRSWNFRHLLIVFSSLALYWFLRWQYFDSFWPNPVQMKSLAGSNFKIFLWNIWEAKVYLAFLLVGFFVVRDKALKYLITASGMIIIFLYAPSTLLMNFGDRFFLQVSLPLIPFILIEMPVKPRTQFALILLLQLYFLLPFRFNPLISYGQRLEDSYISLGKELKPLSDPQELMVCGEAGAIPHFSGWNNLDPIGLGTKFKGIEQFDSLMMARSPRLIFLYEGKDSELSLKPGLELNQKEREFIFSEKYTRGPAQWFAPNYRIHPFVKSEDPQKSKILEVLDKNSKSSKGSITEFQDWVYSRLAY